MASSWIAVDSKLRDRKVTHRLIEIIACDSNVTVTRLERDRIRASAVGLLVTLWGAVFDQCQNGFIGDVPDSLIEEWAAWWGTPGVFATWVREHHSTDGRINDWDVMHSPVENYRAGNRRRQKRHRDKQRDRERDSNGDSNGEHNVTVTGHRTDRPTVPRTAIELPSGSSHPAEGGGAVVLVQQEIEEPPDPAKLPALRARTKTAILERLVTVTAEIKDGTRERLKAEQRRKLSASVVFMYWAARVGANEQTLFDEKRETLLVNRLKESRDNVHELFYAIDGALRDPWHSGKKTGEKHLKISELFRTRERVEELAEKVHGYKQNIPHPQVQKYAEAIGGEDETEATA